MQRLKLIRFLAPPSTGNTVSTIRKPNKMKWTPTTQWEPFGNPVTTAGPNALAVLPAPPV